MGKGAFGNRGGGGRGGFRGGMLYLRMLRTDWNVLTCLSRPWRWPWWFWWRCIPRSSCRGRP